MQQKDKSLLVALNSIYRYIEDVLSINNSYLHSYINSIYLSELDSTYFEASVSYLVILLEKDFKGNLTTKLYYKNNDFNFSISNFPFFTYVALYHHRLLMGFMFRLIRYLRACSTSEQFLKRSRLLTKMFWNKNIKNLDLNHR